MTKEQEECPYCHDDCAHIPTPSYKDGEIFYVHPGVSQLVFSSSGISHCAFINFCPMCGRKLR